MALDGITLHFIKKELEAYVLGARVEKVYQPSKSELVFLMRTRNGAYRLYLSADASSPRVHLTAYAPENPQNPPMLCMLLRKYLTGATLTAIRQLELDRVLFLDFRATNEIGDPIELTLCIEIMAQHSNIILMHSDGKIIDAVKRIDESKSSYREVLPGGTYVLPPEQDKKSLLTYKADEICDSVLSFPNKKLTSALLCTVQGVSPIVCREIAARTAGEDIPVYALNTEQQNRLKVVLEEIQDILQNENPKPLTVYQEEQKPLDFSFWDIRQYGDIKKQSFKTFSELLDSFYFERDRALRTKRRANDLYKLVSSTIERISRKLNNQRAELKACENKEQLRIFGELINANQYRLSKGAAFYDLENFYEDNAAVRIPVNPAFTPNQNAQKYYKDYRKAHTAEKKLAELIADGEQELVYMESVLDLISRAETEGELAALREELTLGGYVKAKRGAKYKAPKALPPLEFTTSDGFKVLVGRNNVQNDKLSLKTAKNYDMWLHTQGFAGSHTIILSENKEITDCAILEAAGLAAYHSKARESTNVPVDYTLVKNLKKPQGAKPGKVIYHVYNTVYVTPQRELAEQLSKKK